MSQETYRVIKTEPLRDIDYAIIHEELFEEELLSLKKKLTLGQIISMYSVLREELSVIEYDLTTGSLGIEDDA